MNHNDIYKESERLENLRRFNIEKSIEGTEAFGINQDIIKGLSEEEILEKARSGIYKDTYENRKKGIVGQKYGGKGNSEKDKIEIKNVKIGDSFIYKNPPYQDVKVRVIGIGKDSVNLKALNSTNDFEEGEEWETNHSDFQGGEGFYKLENDKKSKDSKKPERSGNEPDSLKNQDKSVESIISSIKYIDSIKSTLKHRGYGDNHPNIEKIDKFREKFIDKSNQIVRLNKGENIFDFKISPAWYDGGMKASIDMKVGILKNDLYDKFKEEYRVKREKYPNGFSPDEFFAEKVKNVVNKTNIDTIGGSNYSSDSTHVYKSFGRVEIN